MMLTTEGKCLLKASREIIVGTEHEEALFPKAKTMEDRADDKWVESKLDQIMNEYQKGKL